MIAAKKMLLAGRGQAKPFTLSGSWDNVNDGWTFGDGVQFSTTRRSGSHGLTIDAANSSGIVTRTLRFIDYKGLNISMRAYGRQNSGNSDFVIFGYLNDQGVEVTVSHHEIINTQVFRLCQSPNFPLEPVGNKDITLFIRFGNSTIVIDDWNITGVKP